MKKLTREQTAAAMLRHGWRRTPQYCEAVADWLDPPARKAGRRPLALYSERWWVHHHVAEVRSSGLPPRGAIELIRLRLQIFLRAISRNANGKDIRETELQRFERLLPQIKVELRRSRGRAKRSTNHPRKRPNCC